MGPYARRSNQLFAATVVLLSLSVIETTHGEKPGSGMFQMDLMHNQHVKTLSLKDRIIIAVKSSQGRAKDFNRRISGEIQYTSKALEEPLYSNEGDYLITVGLGTPPQTRIVSADTGSDLFWVQCDCISCYYPEPDPPFVSSASSTFQNQGCLSSLCPLLPAYNCTSSGGCEYNYGYGDGSTTQGLIASDVLTLGSSSFNVEFGCGEKNQGLFAGSDGLIGLGQGPISIIRQMGSNFGSVFSYCLTGFYSPPSQTSPLIFGNSGDVYEYTPLVRDPLASSTFYYVKLLSILVNNVALSIPEGTFDIDGSGSGGIIVDSGTTITQLQVAAYTPLLNTITSLIDYPQINGSDLGLDACYRPNVANPSWPQVTFEFQDVTIVLPGDNLFLLVDNEGDYCMAVQGSPFSLGIYGNVQQQNFNIQFDIENSQVGFSGPTTC